MLHSPTAASRSPPPARVEPELRPLGPRSYGKAMEKLKHPSYGGKPWVNPG